MTAKLGQHGAKWEARVFADDMYLAINSLRGIDKYAREVPLHNLFCLPSDKKLKGKRSFHLGAYSFFRVVFFFVVQESKQEKKSSLLILTLYKVYLDP